MGLQAKCCFSIPFLRENLYSSSLGGGVATSPMLIVFHGKYSTINPLWHIRHLGKYLRRTQLCILHTQWAPRWADSAIAPVSSIQILQVTSDITLGMLFNPRCSHSANAADQNDLRGVSTKSGKAVRLMLSIKDVLDKHFNCCYDRTFTVRAFSGAFIALLQ